MITILLFVVMYAAGMIVFNDKGFAKPQMFPESVHFQCRSSGYRDGRNDRYDHSWNRYLQLVLLQHFVWLLSANQMENHGASAYTALLMALVIGLLFGLVPGIPGILSGDPAIHCNTGRYVL